MTDPKSRPAVSVVVPCYNGGRFLDQLTRTFANQTFRDFEVVIVDDGSTDDTRERLAQLPAPFRVLHQANQGPAAARNTGIRAAQADIIVALDCDDELDPAFLEETVRAMRAAPEDVGLLFTHERMVGLRTGIARNYFKLFDQLFVNRAPSCLMMRKSAWEAAGGYDAVGFRDGYEDWEFTVAVGAAGYRALVIPKPLFTYRVGNDGFMLTHAAKRHAQLWRRIRRKHHRLYRLPSLAKLWWATRNEPGHLTLRRAALLLLMTSVLPDEWFSAIINRLRAAKMAREVSAAG